MPARARGTYSHADYQTIAEAIHVPLARVTAHSGEFEGSARWFRTDSSSRRIAPRKTSRKLEAIAKSAKRLLRHLGVDKESAPDGPADDEILVYLAGATEGGEDQVIAATARIGRLAEIIKAAEAAEELRRSAEAGTEDARRIGKQTTPPRNSAISAENAWIDAMLSLYQTIKGNAPATSVKSPADLDPGAASGPLIRFVQAAAAPLGIQLTDYALRERIKTSLKAARKKPKPTI